MHTSYKKVEYILSLWLSFILGSTFLINPVSAQVQTGEDTTRLEEQIEDEERITLERAEELVKDKKDPNVKKLIRRVVVKHKGSVLYCDSAYLHEDKNAVDAYGHARLIGSDGTRLTSDSMYYDGETQIAQAIGDVLLVDESTRLKTKQLDYNLEEGVAYYYMGGEIVDPEKTLESRTGSYDTNSKIFYYKQDVLLVTRDGKKIETDDLTYNTISKIAYFQGPTWITNDNGKVYTEAGNFNTETEVSNFKGRTQLEDDAYILEGDSLYFDNTQQNGFVKGNVMLFSKEDSVLINGKEGWFKGEVGQSKIYGEALMRTISEGDTTYLRADTMYYETQEETQTKIYFAYPQPKIFRSDLQGRCDSLIYNRQDSIMHMYGDPVLWNESSQLSADSIFLIMADGKIYTMHMRFNSFMISEDSLENYNQLKGKHMQAFFVDNNVRRLNVRGNAQNVYFVTEGDTVNIGLNRVECSDMDIYFKEANELDRITYLNKVDAVFVPPHEIQAPQTRLKNFRWRVEERPQKAQMMEGYDLNVSLNANKLLKEEVFETILLNFGKYL